MTRTRSLAATLLLTVLAVLLAVLLAPSPASATTVNDVAAALRSNPVYVDPTVTEQVDVGRLRAAVQAAGRPVYVAVLPERAAANGGRLALMQNLGRALGDQRAILFVATGTTLTGGAGDSSGLAPGEADRIATGNQGGDLTDTLVRSIREATQAAADGAPAGSSSSGGFSSSNGTGSASGSSDSGGGGGAVLGLLAVLAAGGGGLLYARSRKRQKKDLEGSRADVESLYHRLGADVAQLAPGDDPVARQALADAAERYNATGALLAQADTPAEFAAARRTAVEGLTAARLVRQRLGLDPGPDIPPPPGEGPQLRAPERVRVGDDEYEGSPTYAPGRQHYWGGGYVGGRMVPGGWYSVPFWESMLVGSMIGSSLGGGFGGGYGGYERGYEEGVEDAREDLHDSGGWGGGGFGGGDWGGGGGDFGGGGDGGGSW